MRFVIALISTLAFLAPAWGQVCSTHTVQGTYSVTCTGYLSPAPNAPLVPFTALATIQGDSHGNISGAGKASVGGAIVDQTFSGTATVKSDCTSTVSYDQKINGQPAPKLNIVAHVLDDGKEIRGMAVDAGAVLSCNLRLMSRHFGGRQE